MGDQKIAKNHQKWSFFDHFLDPSGPDTWGDRPKRAPGSWTSGETRFGTPPPTRNFVNCHPWKNHEKTRNFGYFRPRGPSEGWKPEPPRLSRTFILLALGSSSGTFRCIYCAIRFFNKNDQKMTPE